jgi:flagellin
MAYEPMSFAVGFNAEYGGIQNSLFQVQKKLDKTMEKLSTGQRINDMKDDEGGKAIADTMSSWKSGTDESIYNLKEFITMTKVAEKALDDIQDVLFEMKSTVDRLAGIEDATDRSAANAQLRELAMAINKIAEHTEYKGFKLFNMDGDSENNRSYLVHTTKDDETAYHHTDRFIRYGAGAEDYLSWDLGMDPRANQLGMVMGTKLSIVTRDSNGNAIKAEDALKKLYLNGKNIGQIAEENGIDLGTKEGKITAIKLALGENVKVDIIDTQIGDTASTTYKTVEDIYIQTPGDFVYGYEYKQTDSTGAVITGIKQQVINSTVLTTYEREFEGSLADKRLEGDLATITITGSGGDVTFTGATDDQAIDDDNGTKYTGIEGNRQYAVYFANVDNESNDIDQIKSTSGNPVTDFGQVTADEGLFDLNVMSNENVALARVQIEAAINQINELRGVLAAMQHQAESLINQRMEESVGAESQISHIVDTDYAKELAQFTKDQIAQQAGVNMLSQKRQAAQLITQLLR